MQPTAARKTGRFNKMHGALRALHVSLNNAFTRTVSKCLKGNNGHEATLQIEWNEVIVSGERHMKLFWNFHPKPKTVSGEDMGQFPAGLISGRMPRSGKLPVLFLLTGQKSGFSPRRGDSLHRFRSNFAVQTGTGGPLGCAKFHVNRCRRVGMRPQKYQKFPLFGKESPRRGDSLDRFPKCLGFFYTPNYPTFAFQISCDSHHRLRSYCGETARR